ncbi:MAG: hypothetical protein ACRDF4_05385, partial [Rhabdochlamydiaceae bacterium]
TKARMLLKIMKNLGLDFPGDKKKSSGDMREFDSNFRQGEKGFRRGKKGEGWDEDKLVGTDVGDNDVKGEHSSLKPFPREFVQAAANHKLTVPLNYGVQKSLKKLAHRLEKTIDPLVRKVNRMERIVSSTPMKKSRIAGAEENKDVSAVRDLADRSFAAHLFGRTE